MQNNRQNIFYPETILSIETDHSLVTSPILRMGSFKSQIDNNKKVMAIGQLLSRNISPERA